MPITKSQIKRLKISEKQRKRNQSVKSALKTSIHQFETAIGSGDIEEARERYDHASRLLDKAASKGVIHKNKAANEKSRMSHNLSDMK